MKFDVCVPVVHLASSRPLPAAKDLVTARLLSDGEHACDGLVGWRTGLLKGELAANRKSFDKHTSGKLPMYM